MNIGIYIYNQAEVLDFSGPFEVFSTASRFLSQNEKFNVFLIAVLLFVLKFCLLFVAVNKNVSSYTELLFIDSIIKVIS